MARYPNIREYRIREAAPDLLAALEAAVKVMDFAAERLDAPSKSAMREDIAAARAAIAKAKGEA